ncbi:hypothetical protein [Salipiger abyssi]|uniref:hypothetical protein n=1 Tax=Salipiger abyssi TaxID=1250539 RepID=UPI001A8C0687|nr:hypothetical protein [Salipiger abyssi]MBN9885944.1 hypothetical protein [Salipiger abyssi]
MSSTALKSASWQLSSQKEPLKRRFSAPSIAFTRNIVTAKHSYEDAVETATQTSLKALIKGMLVLREEKRISDQQFADTLETLLASYIENEVRSRVEDVVSRKLDEVIAQRLSVL